MHMRFNVGEMKSAISATEDMAKRIPRDFTESDSPMAVMIDGNEASLVTARDYFVSKISLQSVHIVGERTMSGDKTLIGIPDPAKLRKLLAKMKKTSDVDCNIDGDSDSMSITTDDESEEYLLQTGRCDKISAMLSAEDKETCVAHIDVDQFMLLCNAVSSTGKVIDQSVSLPFTSNVLIDSRPSAERTMRVLGCSMESGLIATYTLPVTSIIDFNALIPKQMAEPLESFASKIASSDCGDITVSCALDDVDDNGASHASRISFECDSFGVSLTCSPDSYMSDSLYRQAAESNSPLCAYDVQTKMLKDSMSKLSVCADSPNANTDIEIFEGGSALLTQHPGDNRDLVAGRIMIDDGTLSTFNPGAKTPSVSACTKIFCLLKAMQLSGLGKQVRFGICGNGMNGGFKKNRVMLKSIGEDMSLTVIILSALA